MTHTSVKHSIEMEQPNLMGEGGGLYVETNVKVGFYLGSKADKSKVDAAFEKAKQFICDAERLWYGHDFDGILELYRKNRCVNNPAHGRTATEMERMERQARN
jgi:hypothetical protein